MVGFICWLKGHQWRLIQDWAGVQLYACKRCQRVNAAFEG